LDKQREKGVATGLMGWVTVLWLSLMSVPAPALITGQLEKGTPRDAAWELVEKLGYQSASCDLVLLGEEDARLAYAEFFRADCGQAQLFLKFDNKPAAQAFLPMMRLLENEPALSAAIVQPIAEFSVTREGERHYCSAYPWVAGDTLEALLDKVREPEQEAEYLAGIYYKIGQLLGEMHGASLVNADKPLAELQSYLVQRDLHRANLKITPDNSIVILDIDSFTGRQKPVSVQKVFVKDFIALVFFGGPAFFFMDEPPSLSWLTVLPPVAEAMMTAYCETLMGKDQAAACVSEMVEKIVTKLWWWRQFMKEYFKNGEEERKLEKDKQNRVDGGKTSTAVKKEEEIPTIVTKEELERRLEMVFGPLR